MPRDFTRIATDIPGAEGPLFDHLGRFFCVQPWDGLILEINLSTGAKRIHANTSGIPAGLQVDPENHLLVADMKLGLLRVSPDGAIHDLVRTFEGSPIRGCNDCCLDSKGNLYFSAPAGSSGDSPVGEAFCRSADGTVTRVDQGFRFSNGVAVSPDETQLIVAETFTKSLWSYDMCGRGIFGNKHLFATLPGATPGGPDGLDFDSAGNLLAAHWGGSSIDVFSPNGQLIDRITTPFEQPSNLHFGGPAGTDLYITEHSTNSLWHTTWYHAGIRLPRPPV